jgi:hypothetical protein
MFELAKNIGYGFVNPVTAFKNNADFEEKQQEAWEKVRKSIDEDIPVYAWELASAEYYVINGYNDTGYYYNGPGVEATEGPKPWKELGNTDIGILETYGIAESQPSDDATTVKEALEFALRHAQNPEEWVFPNYRSGLKGYEVWIDTVEKGKASQLGMWYNSAVWAECRALGIKFLDEASQRLDGEAVSLLEDAVRCYFPVVENLSKLFELIPRSFSMDVISEETAKEAAVHLKKARKAEEQGLKALEDIVGAI